MRIKNRATVAKAMREMRRKAYATETIPRYWNHRVREAGRTLDANIQAAYDDAVGNRAERLDGRPVSCPVCLDESRYSLADELRETFAAYNFPMFRSKNAADIITHLGQTLKKCRDALSFAEQVKLSQEIVAEIIAEERAENDS